MESHSDLSLSNTSTDHAQLTHPPYDEMITAAILAMNEKNGSSKKAIALYIKCEYKNFSIDHASLLNQHLRKMKNMGKLVRNKRSYMLPRSGSGDGVGTGQSESVVDEGSSVGSKKKLGRPPKIQSNGGRIEAGNGGGGGTVSGVVGITAPAPVPVPVPSLFDPIGVVRMGEVDGGSGILGVTHAVPVPFDPIGAAPKDSNGKEVVLVGKKPGRPPKVNNEIFVVGEGGSVLGKRRRGCPAKKTGTLMGIGSGLKRGRGRPPKMRATGLVMGQRPRGQPRKGARKLGGKPLGRPKKGASVLAIQSSSRQQLTSYEDLKGRLEHFQTRVRHAVDVVKPYLSNELAPVALRVLQDIEGFDLCASVPRGVLIGDSEAVTAPNGAPLSDCGPLSDPVAALSGQGSEPSN